MGRGFIHSSEDVAPVCRGNEEAKLNGKALSLRVTYGDEV